MIFYRHNEIEKFLRDFVFRITSSLTFLAFYMQVPYKVVPYKKLSPTFISNISSASQFFTLLTVHKEFYKSDPIFSWFFGYLGTLLLSKGRLLFLVTFWRWWLARYAYIYNTHWTDRLKIHGIIKKCSVITEPFLLLVNCNRRSPCFNRITHRLDHRKYISYLQLITMGKRTNMKN